MTASSSKGVTVDLVTGGATGTSVTATAASLTKPSTISVSATTGMTDGDIAVLASDSTGISELDGKGWIIDNISGGSDFDLLGSDATGSSDSFAAGSDIIVYDSTDLTRLCFSEITFNNEDPESVSTGTFCDPTAQIVSAASQAGTIDFAGFIDITDPGYVELLEAKYDGQMRWMKIHLPNNGYLIVPITISQISFEIPIDGALGFSGSAIMNSDVRHLF